MQTFHPLVSIVIPVYNGSNYMREAIDSALNQTYDNIEVIVVNDGSKDNTDEIAKSYGDKIRYFSKENGGVSTALNLAIKNAKGEYISWLSHDDVYLPEKVKQQVEYLSGLENKDGYILYSDYEFIDSGSKVVNQVRLNHEMLEKKPEYGLLRSAINGIALFIPKRAFDEYGSFDETLRCTQDYAKWHEMMRTYRFVHVSGILVQYRSHDMQDTQRNPLVASEGNTLWIRMMQDLSLETKKRLEGSEYNFYKELSLFLKPTPYDKAVEFCENKMSEIKSNSFSVVFISHSAAISGAELCLLELLADLSKREDVACHVILPEKGVLEERLKEIGISYSIIPFRWWTLREGESRESAVKEIMQQTIGVLKEIDDLKPDVIYSNTSVINIGAMIAQELNVPHIWHMHELGKKPFDFPFILSEKERAQYMDTHSDFTIFNSHFTQDYYKEISPFLSSKVVYPNVSIEEKSSFDMSVFKRDKSCKLAIVGSVYPGKNQREAILVIHELVKEGFDVELAIVGGAANDSYEKELKNFIQENDLSDRIIFTGFIENPFGLMQQSDIVLICSQNESFGRTVVEGMLAKKPVVGANSGGVAELIVEGESGFLYTPGDVAQLKEKIKALMHTPEKRISMGLNGYEYAKKHFSKEQYSGRIYDILKEVVDHHKESHSVKKEYGFVFRNYMVSEIRDLNQKLQEAEQSLHEKESELMFVKSSKFWKLRNQYERIKKIFR